jgi:YHS domain-containing protein
MIKVIAFLSILLLFSGCATSSAGSDSNPAIGGYCPVCYFSASKAVKGSPEFSASHAGKTYYFASEQARSTFERNPDQYLPAYDGWCAYGVAYGQKVEVDPKVFSVVDGKLYLNKNQWVGRSFENDKAKYITKADQEWPKLK